MLCFRLNQKMNLNADEHSVVGPNRMQVKRDDQVATEEWRTLAIEAMLPVAGERAAAVPVDPADTVHRQHSPVAVPVRNIPARARVDQHHPFDANIVAREADLEDDDTGERARSEETVGPAHAAGRRRANSDGQNLIPTRMKTGGVHQPFASRESWMSGHPALTFAGPMRIP